MQDYSLNDQEANKFIINYEIKDNKIEINYANGDIKEIAYSAEAEKGILEKMENQVQNCQKFKKRQEKALGKYRTENHHYWKIIKAGLVTLIGGFLTILAIFTFFTDLNIMDALTILIVSVSVTSIGAFPEPIIEVIASKRKINEIQATLEDIEKHELFLENEKEIIMDKETPSLNINDLDKMQLADIESILLNIKRNKLLNLKQENDLVEDNLFTPEELTKDEEYTRTKSLN